jgi:chromosome segregation ATPase
VAKLERELDEANKAHTEIQGNLNEANTTIGQLRKDLYAAQGQLKEKEAKAQELTTELRKPRRTSTHNLLLRKKRLKSSSRLSPTRQRINSRKAKSGLSI